MILVVKSVKAPQSLYQSLEEFNRSVFRQQTNFSVLKLPETHLVQGLIEHYVSVAGFQNPPAYLDLTHCAQHIQFNPSTAASKHFRFTFWNSIHYEAFGITQDNLDALASTIFSNLSDYYRELSISDIQAYIQTHRSTQEWTDLANHQISGKRAKLTISAFLDLKK